MPLQEQTWPESSAARFRERLLDWYDHHQRNLPWRRDRDPYRVWISEIMLQQTRVAAVVEHYRRFLKLFPNIKKLASARESSVLAAWSGLGYYRRARMLHAAAKKIVKEMGGTFPVNASELQELPGIGRYTANAIASIAFGEPVAVVDGNVQRVLQRMSGRPVDGKDLWAMATRLISRERPGDFNQAIMELGATVCVPRRPLCLTCPVCDLCVTRGELENPRRERRHKKEICYVLDSRNGSVFLVRRPKDASQMPGMWELPQLVGPNGRSRNYRREDWPRLRHSITNTDFVIRVVRGAAKSEAKGRWVENRRLTALPLTGLTRKILRRAEPL